MRVLSQFFKMEAASGILLLIMTALALILCNSPWADFYQRLRELPIALHIGQFSLDEPLLFWINDGLMTWFFLNVGLELKYEFIQGELTTYRHVALPAMAALGGMIVPALIYALINWQYPEALKGWAVPIATDIAFATGVLSLFGKRVPMALKVFLLALAIFDDVGAVIVIAVFHTASLSYYSLLLAVILSGVLIVFNAIGVRQLWAYLFVGLLLWLSLLDAGVHSTMAGVILGLIIPLVKQENEHASPMTRLRQRIHPWVAYFVMPIFAFANAGISLAGITFDIFLSSVVWGTGLGLFFGKQMGAFLFSWFMIRFNWASLPTNTSWFALYGVTVICGIGFTMSLFLGTLAFADSHPNYLTEVRLGVLLGSLVSGLVGTTFLSMAFFKKDNELGEEF